MRTITNNTGIPLALAVWVVHDEYDYVNHPNYISATQLMKPIRQIVLAPRVTDEAAPNDVYDFVAAALGTSIHDSVEKAWVKGYTRNLKKLGYPDSVIKRVLINPTKAELDAAEDPIPVYLEQRSVKEIDGHLVGGKYDLVAEGIIHDVKSTSAYAWLFGGKDEDYILQGSIYRWLNQEIVTEDFIRIVFVFTDWQKAAARKDPKYPQKRLEQRELPLWSLEKTEAWLRAKIASVVKYKDAPDSAIPECTDEELWKSDPVFKYYSDPSKLLKATKNFTELVAARKYMVDEKGGKGIIITVPGEVKRCDYCAAAPVCEQYKKLFPTTI